MTEMLGHLEKIEQRYLQIDQEMAQPEVATDVRRLQALAQERSGIENIVRYYREYRAAAKSLEDIRKMLNDGLDPDMRALAEEEVKTLTARIDKLQEDIKVALLPKDPNDDRDIIMEIRAGTGGDEAGLFAADLFRMYSRYAQSRNYKLDILSSSEGSAGGFKEIIFEVKGRGAYSRFKYERGVHRVQRVPTTEAAGRIHTSTATVAVLPAAEEVDVSINPKDLRIDIYHSSGAGGQNVNKVSSAVRLTHIPTGIVVACQDERSQLQNKVKAFAIMRARLLDLQQREQGEKVTEERRAQVGSGERSEKIRTYNFPQDRLSDHRIGLTMHNLPRILGGDLDELIDALATSDQAKQLEAQLV
ncbi:MAG: peptide chain release factor 1 [Dehalococcoidales bacterium]|nr:peptide chain release factor 1 [Dehalococcoidales bacterium]